jgi:hypothetical protein
VVAIVLLPVVIGLSILYGRNLRLRGSWSKHGSAEVEVNSGNNKEKLNGEGTLGQKGPGEENSNPLGEARMEPTTKEPETQTGSVEVHNRVDESITVTYRLPFLCPPNLNFKIKEGWVKYEMIDEGTDKFVFRVTEVIGYGIVHWIAEGKLAKR